MTNARLVFLVGLLISLSTTVVRAQHLELYQQAVAAKSKNEIKSAEELFLQIIQKTNQLHEFAYYELAQIALQRNDLDAALRSYTALLSLSPNLKLQYDTQLEMSKIFNQQKKYSKALEQLRKLEKKMRRESVYPQILVEMARADRGQGQLGNFCKSIRKLYSKHPDFVGIQNWTLKLQDDVFDGKKTGCMPTADEKKTRIKNFQWVGLEDRAMSEIAEYKKEAQPSEVQNLEVSYLLHEGEVKKALELLLSNYEERKTDFNYLTGLGTAAARAGEVQLAVGSYYQAYKRGGKSRDSRKALYQSAFLSYQFQDYDGAYRKFQEFMKAFPQSGLSQDAKWHLAWIQYLRGDYVVSMRSFKELSVQKSRRGKQSRINERAQYWMGMSLLRLKKFEEAKAVFEKMSKDNLLGYYSIAAADRLKRIEAEMPKRVSKIPSEPTRRVAMARFSMGETLMPSDEASFSNVSEEAESEESLAASVSNENNAEPTDAASEEEVADNTDRPAEVADAESEEDTKTSFSSPVLMQRFERARDLMILGLPEWAKWDLYDIERKTTNREYLKTLMTEYETTENFNRSSYIGQVYFGSQRALHGVQGVRYLWEHTYPKAYAKFVLGYADKFSLPSELVWGIMRAESQYKRDVVSPVGALGLMQVMPTTGQKVSKLLGEKEFKADSLLEPDSAIKIGSRYLSRLMRTFDNSLPLVAAAYNAGPHRVKTWLASFGERDMDEMIEHIPFLETRNYVKKVISNIHVYNILYRPKSGVLSSLADMNKVRFQESIVTKENWDEI